VSEVGDAPEHPLFRALAVWVLRHRVVCLLSCLCVSGWLTYQSAAHLRVDNSTEAFLSGESEAMSNLRVLQSRFGNDRVLHMLVSGDVYSAEYLRRLSALHDAVEAVELQPMADDEPTFAEELPAAGAAHDDTFVEDSFAGDSFVEDSFDVDGTGDPFEDGTDGWEQGPRPAVDQVVSLVNARATRYAGGALRVDKLLDPMPQTDAELSALRKRVEADVMLGGKLVGRDAKHSLMVVRPHRLTETGIDRVFERLSAIAREHNADGFAVEVGGVPALNYTLKRLALQDVVRMVVLSSLAMLAMLIWIFRHPMGLWGPMAVVAQAALWTVGAMSATGAPMTIVSNILPAFIICVGAGDSIHVQSVYRQARLRGVDNEAAIVHAVATTGMPVLFTSITTALGLLSFRMASLQAIQDMGTFGAVGVVAALVLSVTCLPAVLSYNQHSLIGAEAAARHDRIGALLRACGALSAGSTWRRNRVLLVGVALAVLSTLAMRDLEVYHNPLTWLPGDDETRRGVETVDAQLGGTADLVVMIDAREDGPGLRSLAFMRGLEKLHAHILDYRDPRSGEAIVGHVASLADVVRESFHAVKGGEGGEGGRRRLPESDRGVSDMLTLFENASPADLRRVVTIDMKSTLVVVQVKWVDAMAYGPLTDHVRRGVEKHLPAGYDITVTGAVHSTLAVVRALIGDLLRSFGFAFVAITVIMILLLRELKLGLISMVPNLLPIACILGVMGVGGVPLDTNTMMVASVIIGIAVDDTIHFLHQFRCHYRVFDDVSKAIDHALEHSGRAMATTSIILCTGFASLAGATMASTQRFGLLVAIAVVFALLIDLIFAPALLRLTYKSGRNGAPTRAPDVQAS